jgi:hypothetical protein
MNARMIDRCVSAPSLYSLDPAISRDSKAIINALRDLQRRNAGSR